MTVFRIFNFQNLWIEFRFLIENFIFFNQFCFDFWSFMIRFKNLQFSEFLIFVKFFFFRFITFHIFIEQSWNEMKISLHMSKKFDFSYDDAFVWKSENNNQLFRYFIALRKWKREFEMRKIKWNFFIFFFKNLFWRNLFYNF